MIRLSQIMEYLEKFAPLELAEDWDNVGLLVGNPDSVIEKVMTCLTITPNVVDEAIQSHTELIVAHHPMPFRGLKKITTDTKEGAMILRMIQSGISVYSPHTAFDSAMDGINQQWAEGLGLQNIQPIRMIDEEHGAGRIGDLSAEISLDNLIQKAKDWVQVQQMRVIRANTQTVKRIAIACGSAGEFLTDAKKQGCDAFITGETSFHTCLDAEASHTAMLLTNHYASERFAVETLAESLSKEFEELKVTASQSETDPIEWC